MKLPAWLIGVGVVLLVLGAWMRADNEYGAPGPFVGVGALAQLVAVLLLLGGLIVAAVRFARR